MSVPIEELHREVWTVKEHLTMSNWEKKVALQALDLLFRSGYYGKVIVNKSKD